MLFGQHPAGTAETGLDLIQYEENILPGAKLSRPFHIAERRKYDPSLALDRFYQKRHRVGRDCRFQCRRVAEGNTLEPRYKGAETFTRARIAGEADNGDGAAVEIVIADNDLGAAIRNALDRIAPFARQLEGAFHRFSAGIHWQHPVRPGKCANLFIEGRQLIIAEGARGEGQAGRLIDHRLPDARDGSAPD